MGQAYARQQHVRHDNRAAAALCPCTVFRQTSIKVCRKASRSSAKSGLAKSMSLQQSNRQTSGPQPASELRIQYSVY